MLRFLLSSLLNPYKVKDIITTLSNLFFMHLIATNYPVIIDLAFKTSEKVPSPILTKI